MSENRPDPSELTGPQLVRAFLSEFDKPRTTKAERAAFFDFKARVFAAIADRDGNPDAARAAERARVARDRLLSEAENANGGGA
ncbi:hypothetical protein NGM33_15935 [Nocardiopsis dassonvillei]|uniref:hypothetical protein n=1 Tax=Nocardiopsis dassonvillei TaxID=2014 RepID=UPI00102AB4EA|nr:hypothetical protein [Nocardiopsis dassonvillei]MCP3014825.1 hypothetical protein [Nocardiopsis dassonvillei]